MPKSRGLWCHLATLAVAAGAAPLMAQSSVTASAAGDGWQIVHLGGDCSLFTMKDIKVQGTGGYNDPQLKLEATGSCGAEGLANGKVVLRYAWRMQDGDTEIAFTTEANASGGVLQGQATTTVTIRARGETRFVQAQLKNMPNPIPRFFRDGCEFNLRGTAPDFASPAQPCTAAGLDGVRGQWARNETGSPVPAAANVAPPPAAPAASIASTRTLTPASAAPGVVSANDVQSVIDYLESKGDTVTRGTSDQGTPMLTESRNLYTVYFTCDQGAGTCNAIQFRSCYGFYANATLDRANAWNRQFALAKTYVDDNGFLCVEQTVPTGTGGIAPDTLDLSFNAFLWFRQHSPEQFD